MKTSTIILCCAALLATAALIWLFLPNPKVNRDVNLHPNHGDTSQFSTADGLMETDQPLVIRHSHRVTRASARAVKDMKSAAEKTAIVFASVPDDQTGKQSRWFEQLKLWHQLLEKAAETGTREDLFALVPITASFFARDREVEPLVKSLDDLRHWMEHPGPHIIREIANVVTENGGNLDASTGALAVTVFSVRGFDNEPDWEDERKPIDSAGILISRPEVMPLLKSLTVEQLSFFLRAQTADTFFRRYERSGDGIPVLHQRYSENRAAFHARFTILASKLEARQGSAQQK